MTIDIGSILHTPFGDQYGFKYRNLKTNLSPEEQRRQINTLTHNAIFFQLEGVLQISWDGQDYITIQSGSLYFLPRGATLSACILSDEIKYIVARLEHDLDNKLVLNELRKDKEQKNWFTHSFSPLPIRNPLRSFIASIEHYITDGIDTPQLHNAKFQELYLIFRNYYTKEECLNLFYPILTKNSEFKTYILDNYQVSVSIEELAEKVHMSRSTFDRKFKETFGMTPLKWIEMQTRILIFRKASEPNVTVKDLMYEVGVYNPSQFTKLCKRLCGAVPSKLIQH